MVRSFALRLTPCLDLSALVTCHTLYLLFTSSQSAMFLLNSRMGRFTAPPGITLEDPFSRSYGVMLPSSLTRFLPRALVSLYPPTCVGFGTACISVVRRFSGKQGRMDSPAANRRLGPAVPGRARSSHRPSPLSFSYAAREPSIQVGECWPHFHRLRLSAWP